ncbi:hypothetical protein ABVF33_03750 [Candidatus Rickettsia barbariae]
MDTVVKPRYDTELVFRAIQQGQCLYSS